MKHFTIKNLKVSMVCMFLFLIKADPLSTTLHYNAVWLCSFPHQQEYCFLAIGVYNKLGKSIDVQLFKNQVCCEYCTNVRK